MGILMSSYGFDTRQCKSSEELSDAMQHCQNLTMLDKYKRTKFELEWEINNLNQQLKSTQDKIDILKLKIKEYEESHDIIFYHTKPDW